MVNKRYKGQVCKNVQCILIILLPLNIFAKEPVLHSTKRGEPFIQIHNEGMHTYRMSSEVINGEVNSCSITVYRYEGEDLKYVKQKSYTSLPLDARRALKCKANIRGYDICNYERIQNNYSLVDSKHYSEFSLVPREKRNWSAQLTAFKKQSGEQVIENNEGKYSFGASFYCYTIN